MSNLQTFTTDLWEEQVLHCGKPVLVDFRAPWCPTALLQNHLLEKLAEDLGESAKVGFIDIVRSVDLALICRVHDLPSLTLLFKGKILISYAGPHRIGKMMARRLHLALPH